MELGLSGKIAIVGGASKGLGRACAEGLAREGARMAICSRDPDALGRAAANIAQETGTEVVAMPGDLTTLSNIQDLFRSTVDRFGGVDIVVCNSGGPPPGTAESADENAWDRALQLSLLFFARMGREAVPYMRDRGGGRIINILASTVKQPIPNLVLSAVTRLGAVGFAKTLADEVASDGILVNNVAPGYLLTDRMMEIVEDRARVTGISDDEAMRALESNIPMGRIGRPEELANLVVFLASDAASYVTGTTIQVDGGVIRSML